MYPENKSKCRALELAALSIGVLDAELRRSPVKSIWYQRQYVDTAIRAAALDGYLVEKGRLLALSIGLPVPVKLDEGAHRTGLTILRVALRDHAALEFDDVLNNEADQLVVKMEQAIQRDGSHLLALGSVAYESSGSAFALAVPRFLKRARVSMEMLAGLCGVPANKTVDREAWMLRFLDRIRREATDGRHKLLGLELSWTRWTCLAQIDRRRSDSNLAKALLTVASAGLASPALVARRLRITEVASARLLDDLAAHGVLVELSGRRNWRVFTTEDQADIADAVARSHRLRIKPRGAAEPVSSSRPLPFSPPSPLPEVDFSSAIADVDAALRRIEERLKPRPIISDDVEPAENQ